MERLTMQSKILNEYRLKDDSVNGCQKAIDKLAKYEDAEEQGLLLRLPCAVDSTVYLIKTNGQIASRKADMQFLGVLWDDYGKEWFLTKEEAKQALAEMKGV